MLGAMKSSRFYCWLYPKLSYWKQEFLVFFSGASSILKSQSTALKEQAKEEGLSSDLELTTYIRNWVNINSIHLIDEEHDLYAFKLYKVIKLVSGYSSNEGHRPHLSCGPRAYLLKAILDVLGYKTRIIDLFEMVKGQPYSHTLIEYYDEQLNQWVMQDPDFNAYYTESSRGRPLSANQALNIDSQAMSYESSGYNVENLENLLGTIDDYFELVVVVRWCYQGGKSVVDYCPLHQTYLDRRESSETAFKDYLSSRYAIF